MNILVKRKWYTNNSTISEVYIDGKFFCHALEDMVRSRSAGKVFGYTAIPAGTYEVIYNMSARFKVLMPLLLNVPGYAGVRIHAMNSAADSLGCLGFGVYDVKKPDWISNSKATITKFYALVAKAIKKGRIWITIEDAPDTVNGSVTPLEPNKIELVVPKIENPLV